MRALSVFGRDARVAAGGAVLSDAFLSRLEEWSSAERRDGVPESLRSFATLVDPSLRSTLLLHGAGGSPADFRELAASLARRGISSVCPLLPGHGRGEAGLSELRFDAMLRRAQDCYD